MDEKLFDAAIVDESGIITNILVFDNEDTMHEFGALRFAEGLRIGDKFEEPKKESVQEIFAALVGSGIDEI